MINFFDTIEQNSILWNLEKGENGAYFIDIILRRYDEIISNVSLLNKPIQNDKDLFLYFFKDSLKNAICWASQSNIPEETKEKLKQLDSKIKINVKEFCDYINAHSETLFKKISERSGEDYFVALRCLKESLCYYSKSLLHETMEDILSSCALHILAEYNCYSEYFKKHKDHFVRLFDDIDNTPFLESRTYVYCLVRLDGSKELNTIAKTFAERLCIRFLPLFRECANDSDSQTIFQNKTMFDYYFALARRYRLACGNEYRLLDEVYESTINDYVIKHGQKMPTQRYDLRPLIDELKNESNPYKFLSLTRIVDKNSSSVVFLYDRIFNTERPKNSLVDAVTRSEMPSSEKYPYHIQDALWVNEQFEMSLLNCVVLDDQLSKEYANYLPMIANDIDHELLGGKGNIAIEVAGSLEILANIIGLYDAKKHETPLYQALINGLCENLLNTIEKTLRLLTLKECYDVVFFEEKDLTLGQMLKQGLPMVLSKNLARYLQFYLDVDQSVGQISERPGRNLRNIHMHNLDHKYQRTNYGDCIWLVFILMCVLNELEVFVCLERDQKIKQ